MKALVSICLLLPALMLSGQANLSLEEAILKGLENNFQIRIAEKGAEIAGVNNTLEASGLFPNVVINGANRNQVTDNSQNPTAFIQDKLSSTAFEGSVALDWTLFNGFGVWITRDQLQLLEDQSEGNVSLVVENTVQAIILAYWNAVLQQELMELSKEVTGLSSDRLQYNLDNRELGLATTFDVVQARTALLTDTTSFLQQQLTLIDAGRNLNLLMGEDAESTFTFTTEMSIPEAIPDRSMLSARIDSSNTQLRLQYMDNMLLSQDLKLARNARYPSLSFQSGWSNSANSFTVGELSAEGQVSSYYANFTLSFNLYGGGAVRRNIQALQINEEINQLSTEDLRRSLKNELNVSYDRYAMQQDLVALASLNVDDARTSLRLSEDRFNAGLINSFNYRDAQVAYQNAQYSYFLNLYSLLTTEAALRKLTGELVGN